MNFRRLVSTPAPAIRSQRSAKSQRAQPRLALGLRRGAVAGALLSAVALGALSQTTSVEAAAWAGAGPMGGSSAVRQVDNTESAELYRLAGLADPAARAALLAQHEQLQQ